MRIKLEAHWRTINHYVAPGEYEAGDLPDGVAAYLVQNEVATVIAETPKAKPTAKVQSAPPVEHDPDAMDNGIKVKPTSSDTVQSLRVMYELRYGKEPPKTWSKPRLLKELKKA